MLRSSIRRRRIAQGSDAYGGPLSFARLPRVLKQLTDTTACREKRARVLQFVSQIVSQTLTSADGGGGGGGDHAALLDLFDPLQQQVDHMNGNGDVSLQDVRSGWGWGSEAQLVLGAALLALPCRITTIEAGNCMLTDKGVAPIAELIGRKDSGLQHLFLCDNTMGDAGAALLAGRLPPTLQSLDLSDAGFGDEGMIALAVALPTLRSLDVLSCGGPAIAEAGWKALAGALSQMKRLSNLAIENAEFGDADAGLVALVESLPGASMLESLSVEGTSMGDAGAHALAKVLPRCTTLRKLSLLNDLTTAGAKAALQTSKEACPWAEEMSISYSSVHGEMQQALDMMNDPAAVEQLGQQMQVPGMMELQAAFMQGPEAQAMFQAMAPHMAPEQVAQQVQHAQAVLTNPQALEQLLQQIPMLAAVATPMLEHLQDDPGGAFNNMLQHMEVQTQNHLNANPAMAAAAAAVEHQAQGQGGGG